MCYLRQRRGSLSPPRSRGSVRPSTLKIILHIPAPSPRIYPSIREIPTSYYKRKRNGPASPERDLTLARPFSAYRFLSYSAALFPTVSKTRRVHEYMHTYTYIDGEIMESATMKPSNLFSFDHSHNAARLRGTQSYKAEADSNHPDLICARKLCGRELHIVAK